MDIIMWVVTGGAVGWASYAFFSFNEERGRNVSMILGAVGGILGGKLLAPMLVDAPAADLDVAVIFIAAAAAAAVLALGDLVYSRWGV